MPLAGQELLLERREQGDRVCVALADANDRLDYSSLAQELQQPYHHHLACRSFVFTNLLLC
jgi:hypothetical protein